MEVIRELFAKLGLEIDEAAFAKAEAVMETLEHGLLAVGAAASGAAAIGLAALAAETANAAVAASRLAQSTGLDLKTVQEFGFAAEASGVSTEEMAHALQHLAKTGIHDVKGETLRLAEQFAKMPDSGKKVEMAMEKFGRAGARLIPFLNRGKEGIAELVEEADELGVVLTEADVAAGSKFKASLHKLEGAFKGLGYAIGRVVLPFFTKVVDKFVEFVIWLKKGGPEVDDFIFWMKMLGVALGSVAAAYAALAVAAGLAEVASIGAALAAAVAWAAAALPILVIAGLFAALFLIIQDIYYFATGRKSIIGTYFPENGLKMLLLVKAALIDIQETAKLLWGNSSLAAWAKNTGLLGDPSDKVSVTAGGKPKTNIRDMADQFGSFAMPWAGPSVGASAPGAAAALAPFGYHPGESQQMAASPVVNVTVNPSKGMNEQELGHHVGVAVGDILKDAAAGKAH